MNENIEKSHKFICEKCDYKGNIKSQWKKHINTELHKTGKKKERSDKKDPLKCEKCEYTIKSIIVFLNLIFYRNLLRSIVKRLLKKHLNI